MSLCCGCAPIKWNSTYLAISVRQIELRDIRKRSSVQAVDEFGPSAGHAKPGPLRRSPCLLCSVRRGSSLEVLLQIDFQCCSRMATELRSYCSSIMHIAQLCRTQAL